MRVPAAARRGHQRLAAVLEEVLRELLRDLLDSLIPADALEAVRAALPHALHGVLVATGVVQRLDARKALRAQAAAADGAFRIAFEPNDAPVAHRRDDGAAADARLARGVDLLCLGGRLVGMRFAERRAVDRRRAECGKRSGGGCGFHEPAPRHVELTHTHRLSLSSPYGRRGRTFLRPSRERLCARRRRSPIAWKG